MQRAVNNRFTLRTVSALDAPGEMQALPGRASFYKNLGERLLKGAYSNRRLIDLGDKIVVLAEQAYGFRHGERILELSQAMLVLPLPDSYRLAGRYFQALGLRRRGAIEEGDLALERIASEPAHEYTARALLGFGAVLQGRGDHESAVKLYLDAGRRAAETGRADYLTIQCFTQRNIAGITGLNGDPRRALAKLEQMAPLARAVGSIYPHSYYDYLNNLAVECGNVGRFEQATQACRIALSSPFAVAYPEWHETSKEIESRQQRASRSVVAVPQRDGGANLIEQGVGKSHNVIRLPVAERVIEETATDRYAQFTRARVLNFRQRKTAIRGSSTASEGVTAEQRSRMTTGEKLIRLMDLISQDETDDATIDRILEAVEQIVPSRRSELD